MTLGIPLASNILVMDAMRSTSILWPSNLKSLILIGFCRFVQEPRGAIVFGAGLPGHLYTVLAESPDE